MDAPASLWNNNFGISHTGQRSGGVRPAFLGRLCRLDSAVGNPALRRRPFQTPTADLAASCCRICDSRSAFTGDHGPARGAHRLPATQHQSTCPQIAGLDVRPCSWQAAAAPRKELRARARTAWRLLEEPGRPLAAHDAPVVRASRPAPGPRTPSHRRETSIWAAAGPAASRCSTGCEAAVHLTDVPAAPAQVNWLQET